MTHVVRETSVWGSDRRLLPNLKKRKILVSCRPYIDHPRIYAYKPCHQRGRARESQTFLISFAYSRSVDNSNEEDDFLQLVNDSGLLVCRYQTIFRGIPAYKIVVADRDVNVLHALELLEPDTEETEAALPKWSTLEHLFHNPNALSRDKEQLRQSIAVRIAPHTYQCPHCSWINFHDGEAGHRECDGPMKSEDICAPCASVGWTGIRQNNECRMYYCPGYTISSRNSS